MLTALDPHKKTVFEKGGALTYNALHEDLVHVCVYTRKLMHIYNVINNYIMFGLLTPTPCCIEIA